jgi:hypothetical protein
LFGHGPDPSYFRLPRSPSKGRFPAILGAKLRPKALSEADCPTSRDTGIPGEDGGMVWQTDKTALSTKAAADLFYPMLVILATI